MSFFPPHLFATSSSRVQARCHSGATLPAPLTICSLFLCPPGTKPRRTGTAVAPLPSASRSPAQGLQAEGTEKVRPTQPKALAASGPSQGQRVECCPGRRVHRGHSESPRGGTGAEGPRWEQWCGSRGSCSTATGSEDPRGPGHPAASELWPSGWRRPSWTWPPPHATSGHGEWVCVARAGGGMGVAAHGDGASCWGDGTFWNWTEVVVAQPCKCTECH